MLNKCLLQEILLLFYLSLTELALEKQSNEDLTRIIATPGVLTAIGYCCTSPNRSVPGSLPSVSVPAPIEIQIIFVKDIAT